MDGGGKRPRVINTASKSTCGKGVQRQSGSSHARSAAAGRAEVFDSEADRATTKGTGECEHTTRRRQQFSHNSCGCAWNICFFAQSRPDTYVEVVEEDQYEKRQNLSPGSDCELWCRQAPSPWWEEADGAVREVNMIP